MKICSFFVAFVLQFIVGELLFSVMFEKAGFTNNLNKLQKVCVCPVIKQFSNRHVP